MKRITNQREKALILIIIIIIIIFAIVGSTYAWLSWVSGNNTTVTFTTTSDFSCSVDGGGDITPDNVYIMPTNECTNTDKAIVRKLTLSVENKGSLELTLDLWLDIKEIGTGLSESENFNYALTESPTSCVTDEIVKGTFNGKNNNTKINLLEEKTFTESADEEYYLYIWIDEDEISTDTMNQNFNFKLGGNCTNKPLFKNEPPVLDDGMIPVIISNDGTVTAVSSTDPNWYNYQEKKWANVVLVKDIGIKTRTQNKNPNTVINKNDILAYYVWIPRYAYQIWTETIGNIGQERLIDIKFEEKTAEMKNGNKIGEYKTQPAFWWNLNGDEVVDEGELLPGIWVGKFETNQGTTNDIGTTNPTILPNNKPWVNLTVAQLFTKSLLFSGGSMIDNVVTHIGNNIYGLTNKTNSHMMKNSEWGAVAYLSHSKYGLGNKELRYNNYYNNGVLTGCGAAEGIRKKVTECAIKYGEANEYPQATTGNITGVFDMAGGVYEYVMGNYGNITSVSELSEDWFNILSNKKYYDLYTFADPSSCTIATCGGHALFETFYWYGKSRGFVRKEYPWNDRGGYYNGGMLSGIWSYDYFDGRASSDDTFRSVLVINN